MPAISIGVRQFGRFLRGLSYKTQAAAAAAASIAEVYLFPENIYSIYKLVKKFMLVNCIKSSMVCRNRLVLSEQ